MTIEIVDAIAPIAREWDALVERVGGPPYMRAGWVESWCAAFAARPAILCLRRAGRLAGVLPMRRDRGGLSTLTNAQTPGYALLAEDADVQCSIGRALFAGRVRVVQLAYFDASDPALGRLESAARESAYRVLRSTIQHSPFVALDRGRDGPDAHLGAKHASNLRRLRRRLEREGAVEIEVSDGGRRLDALLAEGIRLEASGWKAARGTAIASRRDTQRFYVRLANWARDAGLLRLAFLRLDGRGLAFQLALQDRFAYYFLKGGYDPEAARLAPGKLLAHEMLGRAAADGLARFEFLGAAEPWKLEWTRDCHERVRVQAFAPTPLGAIDLLAQSGYRRYAKPLAKRTVARRR
jgi:CelD/BcsL family acetyltransferase involved in cellulose biosynthesis